MNKAIKLKTEMVFASAPGQLGALWHNLCVLENQLAELLATEPAGAQAINGVDVWYLEEVDSQHVLMHATLVNGSLCEPSSRFDFDLEWVDIEEEELSAYNCSLQMVITHYVPQKC